MLSTACRSVETVCTCIHAFTTRTMTCIRTRSFHTVVFDVCHLNICDSTVLLYLFQVHSTTLVCTFFILLLYKKNTLHDTITCCFLCLAKRSDVPVHKRNSCRDFRGVRCPTDAFPISQESNYR